MLLISYKAESQIISADIGINGLTCPQCTKTVEMSLQKLEFINEIQMNLQQTSGHITFKDGRRIDLERVSDAVRQAGFSVRYLYAQIYFDSVVSSNGTCQLIKEQYFQFIHSTTKTLNGMTTVKLEGRKYMQSKDYRQIKDELNAKCGNTTQKVFFISYNNEL